MEKIKQIVLMGVFGRDNKAVISKMAAPSKFAYSGVEFVQGRYAGKEIVTFLSGIGRERTARSLEAMGQIYNPRALLLISIGGALEPHFKVGDIVVCERAVSLNGFREQYPAVSEFLAKANFLEGIYTKTFFGNFVTLDHPVLSRQGKSELFHATGAAVVDMETTAAAAWAKEKEVPFLAVRAISDTAGAEFQFDLPAIGNEDQTVNSGKLLKYALRHPWTIPAFARAIHGIVKATSKLEPAAETLIRQI